jgi:hypothetical protein
MFSSLIRVYERYLLTSDPYTDSSASAIASHICGRQAVCCQDTNNVSLLPVAMVTAHTFTNLTVGNADHFQTWLTFIG